MASNLRQKSASSASRQNRPSSRRPSSSGTSRGSRQNAAPRSGSARSGARPGASVRGGSSRRDGASARNGAAPRSSRAAFPAQSRSSQRKALRSSTPPTYRPGVSSRSIGDIRRSDREMRARQRAQKSLARIAAVAAAAVGLLALGLVLYFSPILKVEDVQVNGSAHLTDSDIQALVSVPEGATLLSVDTGAIARSLERDAWVETAVVRREFPHTLAIDVTEREIAAVVEVMTSDAKAVQPWAIASDGVWLMPIPEKDSELGASISPQIYEDAESVLTITGVPFGLIPEIGSVCTDENVENALSILNGLTTDLASAIVKVQATDAESTLLTLSNGIQIAFGSAQDIREKERVCLQIMEQNPDKVAYINVRVVSKPTWRAI